MISTSTPNDVNATLYDIVYSQVKDERETDAEIELIASLTKTGGKVLELGCGTGRHLIKLADKGFILTGLDNSIGMLSEARKKIEDRDTNGDTHTNISLIHADILTYDFGDIKFDLVTSFWNGINEFALRDEDLSAILSKLASILTDGGKIVLNTENISLADPSDMDFELKFQGGEMQWVLKSYDTITKTTIYEERVQMADGRESKANITQRWWSKEELEKAGNEVELTMEVKSIPENEELYLVFSKE